MNIPFGEQELLTLAAPRQGNIPLVDDVPENLQLLSGALRQQDYQVRNASKQWQCNSLP